LEPCLAARRAARSKRAEAQELSPTCTNFTIPKRKAGAVSAISMVLAALRARGKRDTVLARSECKTWRKTADGMGAFASKRTRKHRI
jgi:hypothetical protein